MEDREGGPISIQWDKINDEDWIILKDAEGKEIMRVQKVLWRHDDVVGFTPLIRDEIMKEVQKLYG